MKENEQPIIEVCGLEAKIVEQAEFIIHENDIRTQAQTPPGLIAPMQFFCKEESEIIGTMDKIAFAYQTRRNLPVVPVLRPQFPVGGQNGVPVAAGEIIAYRSRKDPPSDFDLTKILLGRVTLRTQGGTVFLFNGSYYKRLSPIELQTIIREALRNELEIGGSVKQIDNVGKALLTEASIQASDDAWGGENYIAMKNGVLDIRSGLLRPFTPQLFLTYQMQTDWLPQSQCPVFERYLATVTGGEPVLTQRFWQTLGYILSPSCRAKRFILLQGKGDTGKSIIGNLIRAFFGEENVGSVDIFKMGDKFALSSIVSKRANICMDLSNSSLGDQAVAIIKQLTGSDAVQVEEKYKPSYSTYVKCKLIFGTNHQLRTGSWDGAFMNRVLLLPFMYPIPKHLQDHGLPEKLCAEMPGIFYRAICAFNEVARNGYIFAGDDVYRLGCMPNLGDTDVSSPDGISMFLTTCCKESSKGFVATELLYRTYLEFCQLRNYPCIQDYNTFARQLSAEMRSCFPEATPKKQRQGERSLNGYAGIKMIF